jgi:ABC-2 type transport system ATP-binding protein
VPSSDAAAIEVADLRVVRGDVQALRGLTFRVARGQVVGVLGPSGSGKSTLMRALVGVQDNVAGRCEVLGHPAGHPALRRRLGYVTQVAAVYDDLTVRENLRYFAAVIGAPRGDVERVVDQVGLGGEVDRLARSLSGGQHNRVSLAVALLGTPEVLVLDEPTVGLDPVLRRGIWQVIHDLAAGGATVLVSSHVMDEARQCQRLLLLREGRLLADDTEAGLLARTHTDDVGDAFLALIDGADT